MIRISLIFLAVLIFALTAAGELMDDPAAEAVAGDTAAAVNAADADTAAVNKAIADALAAAVNKTAVDTAVPAVNNAAVADTVNKNTAPANTVLVDTAATGRAAIDTSTPSALTDGDLAASTKNSKQATWFSANALYLLFFAASIAVIAATLFYFSKNRNRRRFLTTMRLSVLDREVQKGCRYVESNYMNPNLSPSDVCRELVTGEAYLDALFVKETGITVQDFITQVRVNSLKYLLGQAGDIEKACRQSGFADRAAAEKHFARLCGVGIDDYASARNNIS